MISIEHVVIGLMFLPVRVRPTTCSICVQLCVVVVVCLFLVFNILFEASLQRRRWQLAVYSPTWLSCVMYLGPGLWTMSLP